MATLTKTVAPGRWSTTGTAVTMTAGSVVADDWPADRDQLIIAYNSGASPYYVTITSQADKYGRTGHVTQQSLAAGEIRIFRLTNDGWADSSGNVNVVVENASVKWGIVVL